MKRVLVSLVMVAALFAAGCSGNPAAPSTPAPPAAAQIAGGWSGTFETTNYAPQAVFVTLNQTSTTISGTWVAQSGSSGLAGNISGSVDASSFTGTISFSINQNSGCSASFSGPANAGTLTWSSAGFTGNCNLVAGNPVSPRFVLQRR